MRKKVWKRILSGTLAVAIGLSPSFTYMDRVSASETPTYIVTAKAGEHGSILLDEQEKERIEVVSGQEVFVSVIPEDGYSLESVVATRDDGKEHGLTPVTDGLYKTDAIDADLTVEATFTQEVSMQEQCLNENIVYLYNGANEELGMMTADLGEAGIMYEGHSTTAPNPEPGNTGLDPIYARVVERADGGQYTAYCVEHGVESESGGGVSWVNATMASKELVGDLLAIGFNNGMAGNEREDYQYAMTQVLIWIAMIDGQLSEDNAWANQIAELTTHPEEARSYANELIYKINTRDVIPSFAFTSEEISNEGVLHLGYNVSKGIFEGDFEDTNHVLDRFDFTTEDYTCTRQGDALHIEASKQLSNAGVIGSDHYDTGLPGESAVAYWQSNAQDVATCIEGQSKVTDAYIKVVTDEIPTRDLGIFIQIQKKDAQTDDPLSGAVFGIYDENDTRLGTLKDEGNGRYSYHMSVTKMAGQTLHVQYSVKEEQAPDGYMNSQWQKTFESDVTDNDTMENIYYEAAVTNEPTTTNIPVSITIVKTGYEGKKLSGAQFKVYNKKNQEIAVLEDMGDGVYQTAFDVQKTYGQTLALYYMVKETKAPDGYKLTNWSKEFSSEISDEKTEKISYEAAVSNEPKEIEIPVSIEITKTDVDTHEILSGAVFGVYDKDDQRLGSMKDEGNGSYTWKSSLFGVYDSAIETVLTVKEDLAPDGYIQSGWSKTFEMKDIVTQSTAFILKENITNKKNMGSVTVHKQDQLTGEPLSGCTFEVYEWSAMDMKYVSLGKLTDQGDGSYIKKQLLITTGNGGKFKVAETASTGNYILDHWSREFVLTTKEHDFSVDMTNTNVHDLYSLEKTSDPKGGSNEKDAPEVKEGQIITYTLTLHAKDHFSNVIVKDSLPEGMDLVSGSIQVIDVEGKTTNLMDECYDPGKGMIEWHPIDVTAGETQFIFKAMVHKLNIEDIQAEDGKQTEKIWYRLFSNKASVKVSHDGTPDTEEESNVITHFTRSREANIHKTAALVTTDLKGEDVFEKEDRGTKEIPVSTKLGQTVEYRLSVENTGSINSREMVITDTVPKGTTFVMDSMTAHFEENSKAEIVSMENQNDKDGKTQLIWVIKGLEIDEKADLTFRVLAPQSADDEDTEAVETHRMWENTAYLEDTALEEMMYAAVSVIDKNGTKITHKGSEHVYTESEYKKVSETTYHMVKEAHLLPAVKSCVPESGTYVSNKGDGKIEYQITVKNDGEDLAYNVLIKDTIPKYTTYIENSADHDGFFVGSAEEKTLGWIIKEIQPGESVTVHFSVLADAFNIVGERKIQNIAQYKEISESMKPEDEIKKNEGFKKTNEVIHLQKYEREGTTESKTPEVKTTTTTSAPKTGDSQGEVVKVMVVMAALAFTAILCKKKKASDSNNK